MPNLTETGEKHLEFLTDFTLKLIGDMERDTPRPFGVVDLEPDERVQKYVDFRTILEGASAGSPEALEAIKAIREKHGLSELVKDIIETDKMFARRFRDGEKS